MSLSGSTCNVFIGSKGSHMAYSFLRTTKTNNPTVDVLAILKYQQG